VPKDSMVFGNTETKSAKQSDDSRASPTATHQNVLRLRESKSTIHTAWHF